MAAVLVHGGSARNESPTLVVTRLWRGFDLGEPRETFVWSRGGHIPLLVQRADRRSKAIASCVRRSLWSILIT
jgi:hypothetical protein